jgi:hypothetical protein
MLDMTATEFRTESGTTYVLDRRASMLVRRGAPVAGLAHRPLPVDVAGPIVVGQPARFVVAGERLVTSRVVSVVDR